MNIQKFKLRIIHRLPKVFHKDFYNAFANISNYTITPKPRYVHYEITYRCTCKCVFCSRWEIGPGKINEELSKEEVTSFLDDAIKMGITGISFSGGEPFVRKDIFDIISFCKERGLFVHVNSNGTLVEQNYREINRLVDSVLISIDSENPNVHDRLRGVPGTFEKAIKALDLLDRSKTMVQMVVNSENIDSLYEYIVFVGKKTERIRFQPIHCNTENMLTLSDERLRQFDNIAEKWERFVKKLRESGLKLDGTEKYYNLIPQFLSDPAKLVGKTDCFMGSHAFFLDPYGNAAPCEGIRKPFGNIREEKIADIWEKAVNFRRIYNKKKRRPCACLYSCLEGDIVFWDHFFSIKGTKATFP